MGLTECSSEFEEAWKAADPSKNCERPNPYAVTDGTLGQTTPHTNRTSFPKAGPASSSNEPPSSSPAVLHLPLHCQTQIHGKASWDSSSTHQVSADLKQDSISPTMEEKNGVIVIRSTDRAIFSDHTGTGTASESTWSPSASLCIPGKQWTFPGLSPALFGGKSEAEAHATEAGDGLREARESGPREGVASAKERPLVSWFSSGPPLHTRNDNKDVFQKLERTTSRDEDQIIEVDGWCHLPRFPVQSSPTDKALQSCWGLPEAEVRVWGAQILLALESLHQQGVLCRDLNPRNVLLTSNGEFFPSASTVRRMKTEFIQRVHFDVITGKVCLTFFGQWSEVQSEICSRAADQMYCAPGMTGRHPHSAFLVQLCHPVANYRIAPCMSMNCVRGRVSPHCMWTEIGGVSRITEACDWWSLGALLFELLTGMVSSGCMPIFIPAESMVNHGRNGLTGTYFRLQPLWQLHPAGIHSHTQLLIPDHLSTAAASLLTEVRAEASVQAPATPAHIRLTACFKLFPPILSPSCFSLTPATGWDREVEACATSSATPSSAACPGKLSAVNVCRSFTSTFHPNLNILTKAQISVWPRKSNNKDGNMNEPRIPNYSHGNRK